MGGLRNKLMVINAGSSSLKFKLFQLGGAAAAQGLQVLASGICERVGDPKASFLRVSLNPPPLPPSPWHAHPCRPATHPSSSSSSAGPRKAAKASAARHRCRPRPAVETSRAASSPCPRTPPR